MEVQWRRNERMVDRYRATRPGRRVRPFDLRHGGHCPLYRFGGDPGEAIGMTGRTGTVAGVTPYPADPDADRAVPLVGATTGFALGPAGAADVVWVSGDTVVYPGVLEVAERFTVGTAILHLGKVQFGLTGPTRFTMTGQDAVRLCRRIRPRRIVPVHYEGWSHFHEGRAEITAAFSPDTLTWLTPGVQTLLS